MLLAVSVFSTTLALALAAFVLLNRARTQQLQGTLLAQHELQEELLASTSSDHVLFPHTVPGLSFVLNPHIPRGSWEAHAGESYPVNSLGLRGTEIAEKQPGSTRILLVGDSVIFGWKLKDQDRIASVLQRFCDARLPDAKLEFLTVALPAWNVLDEQLFLERHIDRLAPDFVIWSLIRNDINDSSGVTPPGILASWNSPQKAGEVPFHIAYPWQADLAVPAITERWNENANRIQSFRDSYGVPVMILWWRPQQRAHLDRLTDDGLLDLPYVVIPAKYRYDAANWQLSDRDEHPTPWATEHLAIGLLQALAEVDVIPRAEFTDAENEIAREFAQESRRRLTPSEYAAFYREVALRVPSRLAADDRRTDESVAFGITQQRALRNGLLILRSPRAASRLQVEVQVPPTEYAHRRTITLRIRNQRGDERVAVAELASGRSTVTAELPEPVVDALFEVAWNFNFSTCTSYAFCPSARLLTVGFEP